MNEMQPKFLDAERLGDFWGASAGLLVFGAGMIGTYHWVDIDPHASTLAKEAVIQEIELANNEYQEVLYNNQRLRMKIGEGCVTLMDPFHAGGSLSDIREQEALDMIMAEKGNACGDSPIMLQDNFRKLAESEQAVVDAKSSVVDSSEAKETAINDEVDQREEGLVMRWAVGTMGSAVAGYAGALLVFSNVRRAGERINARRRKKLTNQ
jgi:hypothetical protein